ncbi:ABC transporter ATP-binding protein [Roseovarius sp. SCSIO 43702]|uniref:ABC transporter ATP-binding protein n=1 Tax=Roseovarius sp. SCSIO 43702 TaxID=2823043 RepID=UPI001C72D475|nr:ABC transporter ATP-binding protein [Roseovarius sp. SCSIO 43702]QYX56903.1 ABC transporter ATP-binding protein [Roseovarius sp. SCSIO 43702]
MTDSAPLLELKNLHVGLPARHGTVDIVRDVSFAIMPGEAFGLVGESGSGKSLTALSLIRLLKKPLKVSRGEILFKGEDLRGLSDKAMRNLRGDRIAMIFQEPMTALNPLKTVGRQIAEMFVLHRGKGWAEAERMAVDALAQVKVPAPEERVKAYPHQMSGGMRQRVMIAIALACDPDLLIADEPTTALDVTVQDEVLKLIAELCSARGTAVLLISHDLGVIANMCQRIGVMYSGRLVEERDTYDLFTDPQHPYTKGLLGALPRLGSRHGEAGRARLVDIDSLIEDRESLLQEFYFEPRNPERDPRKRAEAAG